MNKGIVLFAHNNRQIDYAKMSILTAKLANKNLQVPVSLITDPSTSSWMKESKIFSTAANLFDKIIIIPRPEDNNMRNFGDGKSFASAPFTNGNRFNVWDHTPYERTLLVDTDFLILTDNLNKYWNVDSDLLMSPKYNDIIGKDRIGYLDTHISETGIEMYWATTVMFTKNEHTKIFFNLVDFIKQKYKMFADVYRFNPIVYRNDIAFSIAKHIMNGFQKIEEYNLPDVFSVTDKDMLYDVDNGSLKFLLSFKDTNIAASVSSKDVHVMNKFSIVRNYDKLMELAK
jgi:hypothetical protein